MVLSDLGRKINASLASLANRPKIDNEALTGMLKELTLALLESDVNAKLVSTLSTNIRKSVDLNALAQSPPSQHRKIVQHAVFEQLVNLVNPKVMPWQPTKGSLNLVMFVGLQGSGKTTSCTKLAYYYKRKGFKPGLICTDTFRAGAFDQLKQNATKANIPFYGSYTETDPVKIAQDGVARFKKEKFDLIIIDTSGCHVNETDLFGEMTSIATVLNPNNIVFVMDGTIGQTAEMQARNFKNAVNVGSIIMTKMDGHAKGGGAISAVAATGSPIIFIGTGEHIQDLDRFDARAFISKMMGFGDLGGLMEKIQDLNIHENGFFKNIEQGKFTFRDLRDQMNTIMSLGPMSKIMGMLPGMPSDLMSQMGGGDDMGNKRMRNLLAVMDSMTDTELDDDGHLFQTQPSRVARVAKGSGSTVAQVNEILKIHAMFEGMVKQMGGKNGFMSQLLHMQGGSANPTKGMSPAQIAKLQKQMRSKMPPEMVQHMKAMAAANGGKMPTNPQDMIALMAGQGGTLPGMPGLGGMAQMMQGLMGNPNGGMAQMMQGLMGNHNNSGGGGLADLIKNLGMGGGYS